MSAHEFLSANAEIHERILATQLETIVDVASLMAKTIHQTDGLVHLFGAGHSSLVVQEMFPRIGSIGGFNPIVDLPLTRFTAFAGDDVTHRRNLFISTVERYGTLIAEDADFRSSDVVLCSTATGVNAVTIEVALQAKARGASTVALTSLAHAHATEPSHSSGKFLHEVCDHVLDLCTPAGDALIEVGLDARVGGSSTIAACLIGNALMVEVAARIKQMGGRPDVMPSIFFKGESGADRRNRAAAVYDRMWHRARNPRSKT